MKKFKTSMKVVLLLSLLTIIPNAHSQNLGKTFMEELTTSVGGYVKESYTNDDGVITTITIVPSYYTIDLVILQTTMIVNEYSNISYERNWFVDEYGYLVSYILCGQSPVVLIYEEKAKKLVFIY